MSFLKWLAENPDEPEQVQLSLFGDSPKLTARERVDGAIVNKDLNKTIQQKGGTGNVYKVAAEALTQELFDLDTEDLYEGTGGKSGDRATLPKEAQKAFIAGEIRADYDLRKKEIEGTPSQKNQQIVRSVRDSGKETRKGLLW